MQEIFENVRDEVKKTGELAWQLASVQRSSLAAAKFLMSVIDYYSNFYTEEEIEFLQFYFNMKMEMMKE